MDIATMKKVAEGVARREYSLLLGAGASMGSLGGNGQPLPSGPILRDKLVDEFAVLDPGGKHHFVPCIRGCQTKQPYKA